MPSISSINQQVINFANASISSASIPFVSTVTTMGFNTGDNIHWVATGTGVNNTGSAIVTNSLGIIGSASISVSGLPLFASTFNVFLLSAQISGTILKTIENAQNVGGSPATTLGTYGWYAGGNDTTGGTVLSSVVRIDYSNDSPTAASPRGKLSVQRNNFGATFNANYGWVGGGQLPGSTGSSVDRIDYAVDTNAAVTRGPLSSARYGLSATGNVYYGWFISGKSTSNIDRIDYASDNSTAVFRVAISIPTVNFIQDHAAVGNIYYGWFGGGTPAATGTNIYRIDYSNDSINVSTRGPLSSTTGAAAGNWTYGWFVGGRTPVSTVQRIDFANDTTNASPRGPLNIARRNLAGSGNADYGWFGGGVTPTNVSSVERIDYNNDTLTATVRGTLGGTRTEFSATSNYVK